MLSNVDKSCAPNYGMLLLWASLANAIPVSIVQNWCLGWDFKLYCIPGPKPSKIKTRGPMVL